MMRGAWIALGAMLAGGCAGTDDSLTWEEFAASAYREPDTGIYVVNGDEIAENLDQLKEAYYRYRDDVSADVAATQDPLIVNRVGGRDDKWSATTALNLTFCITRSS